MVKRFRSRPLLFRIVAVAQLFVAAYLLVQFILGLTAHFFPPIWVPLLLIVWLVFFFVVINRYLRQSDRSVPITNSSDVE